MVVQGLARRPFLAAPNVVRGRRPAPAARGPKRVRVPYRAHNRVPLHPSVEARVRLHVHRLPRAYVLTKRGADVVGAAVLGVLVLPLLLVLALAVRLDTPGPALYRQVRVGAHGRLFRIYKLRSMTADAERPGHARWATAHDPRVTRVGRFLRRTRLDELPQLWNVLRGEMSLVGPRPERPEFVDHLERAHPGFHLRLMVRPGLTGWAQVCHPYTSSVEEARVKLEYDLYYLVHAGPRIDLTVLARTTRVVLGMSGR